MIPINPQTIRSASGEEMIVLTRAEFDALAKAAEEALEDADDVAIFDRRTAELQATVARTRFLPAEVTSLVIKGDTRLRALRKWRGLTQAELAEKSSLAQGYISDLESGKKAGSVKAVAHLASILDVEAEWLRD